MVRIINNFNILRNRISDTSKIENNAWYTRKLKLTFELPEIRFALSIFIFLIWYFNFNKKAKILSYNSETKRYVIQFKYENEMKQLALKKDNIVLCIPGDDNLWEK